ncbi:1-phosphatidylinositol 4,5-bisphosphate phosphodiesterase zeta-1-like [Platichthys flesus]|uniref:1-phosphatidylinositol 4,5-bisphosphate phosphodiesterase zeta-1-like n=1 Tax=Platichthys flesus TaxID=8260 RepID=UPI002DB6DFB3|nr:1-phosphatidylinositol 4,5-bisphosphate phosphodiesterase zeta-1-like [Platichthys flesus]XP_062245217.1 1-phosphatidylinositol 4,5-bisphosphate phosphodiesterase zeta-1-like [Platichthys flesus]
MKRNKPSTSRRTEIQHLYECYASGQTTLPAHDLVRFLHEKQMELTANQETAESLIGRYEIEETARESRSLTFEGFLRYMESQDCCVFDQTHRSVYQDMDQPLTSYFISSSHNTYLTGDQLVGKSHLNAYVCALRKGCRCLEIDCWDGKNMEPVVYHGRTLTTKILFRDVIETVMQHAFEVSAFPVILSLENHCSQEQQEVIAQYLISIFGEKLLRAPLDHLTTGDLPSPNKKVVVAKALSDLVIYTKSVKFVSFSSSKDSQSCYENTSTTEKKAHKLARASGADFVRHNQKFLSRIYPAAFRTSSSNYNPQEFWNVGSQLVALNFQSMGLPMDLNNGRFQDNGGCGYTLKPAVLMSSETSFDPGCSRCLKATRLLLKVISGSNLPVPRSGKPLDPFVRVEINGIASEPRKKSTHTVKNNSLTPHWDTDMNFHISVPELCLVRFCVRDQTGFLSSDFVGQYTLPFSSLKKGYRWVPLLSRDGCSLEPATLFVFIWYS